MKTSKKSRLLIAITTGTVITFLTAFLCLGVAATMILNNQLDANNEGVVIIGIHVIAVFAGSIVSGIVSRKSLISSACVLGILLLFEMSATVFSYNGEFQNVIGCIVGDIIGATTGVLLLNLSQNKRNVGVKKYRSR